MIPPPLPHLELLVLKNKRRRLRTNCALLVHVVEDMFFCKFVRYYVLRNYRRELSVFDVGWVCFRLSDESMSVYCNSVFTALRGHYRIRWGSDMDQVEIQMFITDVFGNKNV